MPRTPPQQVKRTQGALAEIATFRDNLVRLMAKRGLSQSDLARLTWGTHMEADGREAAKGRDRISHYVRGLQMPETRTIRKLAEALGVTMEELNPPLMPDRRASAPVPRSMSLIGGAPDRAYIQINEVVPTKLAVRIMTMLAEQEDQIEQQPQQQPQTQQRAKVLA